MREFGVEILMAVNVPHADADSVAGHLVEADARGIPSHGIMRLPQYVEAIRSGAVDPVARPALSNPAPAIVRMEGRRALGQVAADRLSEAVASLARTHGLAFGVARDVGHTGRIGAYAEALADRGFVALVTCSGPPSGHWVAPFGARQGRLATNPIAFAYPGGEAPPVLADFSTASMPEGIVRLFHSQGLHAPEDDLLDSDGQPTNDPAVLYATPRGSIRPFGGSRGYRGTALGLLVEVLATLLAGDDVNDESRVGSNLSVLAITPPPNFGRLSDELSRHVRSAAPIDTASPVLLPGDKERLSAARWGSQVAVAASTVRDLERVAAAYEIRSPPPVA